MSDIFVTLKTNKGDIKLKLFADKTPVTSSNFVNLALRDFYNGITFHRVINDFMVQVGCPEGRGTGGPGYQFKDEFDGDLKHTKAGILSMANAGPGTNGSQVFITHVACPWLDGKHSVFGETADDDSMKNLFKIKQGDKIESVQVEGDYAGLFEKNKDQLQQWNEVIDKKFPTLPAAAI